MAAYRVRCLPALSKAKLKATGAACYSNGVPNFYWSGGSAKNQDLRWVYERYHFGDWKLLP